MAIAQKNTSLSVSDSQNSAENYIRTEYDQINLDKTM